MFFDFDKQSATLSTIGKITRLGSMPVQVTLCLPLANSGAKYSSSIRRLSYASITC